MGTVATPAGNCECDNGRSAEERENCPRLKPKTFLPWFELKEKQTNTIDTNKKEVA